VHGHLLQAFDYIGIMHELDEVFLAFKDHVGENPESILEQAHYIVVVLWYGIVEFVAEDIVAYWLDDFWMDEDLTWT